MHRHSLLYDLYMRSALWRFRRWLWFYGGDRRCEGCGNRLRLHGPGPRTLTVHHRTYRRLGRERRSDVQLLCWLCHSAADAWRFKP
jgi:5-methylcytosine-specific restriction endonuclease McrA